MNERDTERALRLLLDHCYQMVEKPEEAHLVIVNTCTVRKKPEEKVYSLLGRLERLKEKYPYVKVVVMGCLAEQEKERLLEKFEGVDLVLGPDRVL